MFPIVSKRPLNAAGTVIEFVIKAPLVAKKCLPGQFIVLRLDEYGERIPLTIADYDREAGTVTIMVQPVGQTTKMLELMEPGDELADFVGPMGKPTEIGHQKRVCVVGGGVGCAISYPVAKGMWEAGIEVEEVAMDVSNWARAEGQDVMARIIAAHDDIEAVICNNDEMALGAVEALKAAGYLVDGGTFVPVVGVDANEEAKIAIKEGTMYASVFNDARGQADAVVKLCKLIADGEEPTSENLGYALDGQYVWVPYVPVTLDNVDNIG